MHIKVHATVTEHAPWPRVAMRLTEYEEHGTIVPDDVALAIAAAYQSPGRIGHVLAELASTGAAVVDELLDDIDATRRDVRTWGGCSTRAELANLDALEAWTRGDTGE